MDKFMFVIAALWQIMPSACQWLPALLGGFPSHQAPSRAGVGFGQADQHRNNIPNFGSGSFIASNPILVQSAAGFARRRDNALTPRDAFFVDLLFHSALEYAGKTVPPTPNATPPPSPFDQFSQGSAARNAGSVTDPSNPFASSPVPPLPDPPTVPPVDVDPSQLVLPPPLPSELGGFGGPPTQRPPTPDPTDEYYEDNDQGLQTPRGQGVTPSSGGDVANPFAQIVTRPTARLVRARRLLVDEPQQQIAHNDAFGEQAAFGEAANFETSVDEATVTEKSPGAVAYGPQQTLKPRTKEVEEILQRIKILN